MKGSKEVMIEKTTYICGECNEEFEEEADCLKHEKQCRGCFNCCHYKTKGINYELRNGKKGFAIINDCLKNSEDFDKNGKNCKKWEYNS
jgi:hypothetical protein